MTIATPRPRFNWPWQAVADGRNILKDRVCPPTAMVCSDSCWEHDAEPTPTRPSRNMMAREAAALTISGAEANTKVRARGNLTTGLLLIIPAFQMTEVDVFGYPA